MEIIPTFVHDQSTSSYSSRRPPHLVAPRIETVASSALHERARSIPVCKARCDSGRSFKATTILENMRATRLYRMEHLKGSPLHVSGSAGNAPHRKRDRAYTDLGH